MENNKSPGNDGFPKEFFETVSVSLAESFLNSIKTVKLKIEFSSSQRQTFIRFIEKKYRNKCFIENWRPILLLFEEKVKKCYGHV